MFLNNYQDKATGTMVYRFPSPTGSSCFSIDTCTIIYLKMLLFPSPGGSSCFSMIYLMPEIPYTDQFPSPTGSSCFSIAQHPDYTDDCKGKVSVPYGVFVFLNSRLEDVHRHVIVSVPYEVFVFLSTKCLHFRKKKPVSVPYGVIGIFNCN